MVASQAGSDAYYPAPQESQRFSVSAAVTDPTITGKLVSGVAPRNGWYRQPVRVVFTCTAGSAPLTSSCPSPAVLGRNGTVQEITRTVTATDGGRGQVTVEGIDIDRQAPRVKVHGVRAHRTYRHWRTVTCTAFDSLSDRATGTDLAGNKRVVRSWYLLRAEG